MARGFKGFYRNIIPIIKKADEPTPILPLELATTDASEWTMSTKGSYISSMTLATNPVVWSMKYIVTASGVSKSLKSATYDISHYNKLRVKGSYSRSRTQNGSNTMRIRLYNADTDTSEYTIRAQSTASGDFDYTIDISGKTGSNYYLYVDVAKIGATESSGLSSYNIKVTLDNVTFTEN